MHALEKEMAAHSSVLAWRIPGTEEPGGLPPMGSHRVGHDGSDLAAAAASAKGIHKSHSQPIPAPWSKLDPWRPPSKHQPYRAVRSSQVTLCFLTPQRHGTHLSICLQTHLCPQSLCPLLHLADFCSSLRQGSHHLWETVLGYGRDHSWTRQNSLCQSSPVREVLCSSQPPS